MNKNVNILEPVRGIEPPTTLYERVIIPFNYTGIGVVARNRTEINGVAVRRISHSATTTYKVYSNVLLRVAIQHELQREVLAFLK